MDSKTLIYIFLVFFTACGGGSNKVVTSPRDDKLPPGTDDCKNDSKNETWKAFQRQVNSGEGFLSVDGLGVRFLENAYKSKSQNCRFKGILYICSGSYYSAVPLYSGERTITDSAENHQVLKDLVAPRPSNFEARICGGKMVQAQIAVIGKSGDSNKADLHRFDFTVPLLVNPVYSSIWQDSKRNKTTQRQYLRPL